MIYRLRVTGLAEQDVRSNHRWWWENRSEEQADRWLVGIDRAIQSLRKRPHRCGYAEEKQRLGREVRQLAFGLGRRPSHRILFEVRDDEVIVYRVRSTRQRELTTGDLEE